MSIPALDRYVIEKETGERWQVIDRLLDADDRVVEWLLYREGKTRGVGLLDLRRDYLGEVNR